MLGCQWQFHFLPVQEGDRSGPDNTKLTLKSCRSCLSRANSIRAHESHGARLGLHSVLVVSTVWKEDKHQPGFISPAALCRRHKHLCNQVLEASVGKGVKACCQDGRSLQ